MSKTENIISILVDLSANDISIVTATQRILELFPRARKTDAITSHIGASAPQTGNRRLVYDAVQQSGPEGITASELALIYGHSRGLHRRLSELERGGWITRNGTRPGESGVPNTVWLVTNQFVGPAII